MQFFPVGKSWDHLKSYLQKVKISNDCISSPTVSSKKYFSSFDAGGESDPIVEAFRSPTMHISGIAISRSPPGSQQQQQQQQQPSQQQQPQSSSATLSPKYQTTVAPVTAPALGVLTVSSAANRTR